MSCVNVLKKEPFSGINAWNFVSTLALTFIIGCVGMVVGATVAIFQLQAFADEGARFTQEEFDKHSTELQSTMTNMNKDVRSNRETIIRIEANQKNQQKLLEQILQKVQ